MGKLRKELSLFQATLYGIGIILGAGIYVLIGQGAGIAGESLWLSFAVAALIAAFTGMSYAELSSMFPKTAAEYVYTKRAFGRRSLAFIVQWVMIFTLIVSASTVALGFGGYFSSLFGIAPFAAAVGLIIVVSVVSYIGIRESAKFNSLSTIIEMSGLVIVVAIGVFFIGSSGINFLSVSYGFGSIMSATALIFFAYLGFEELVNLSEETKNAQKIIPKALIISLVVTTVLYILVSVSAIAVVGVDALASSNAPLTEVVSSVLPQGGFIMSIIALFATANTVLAILIVSSRMLYGLSANGELPPAVGKVGRRKTPYIAILLTMVFGVFALFIGGIKTIALVTDVGIFLVYVFVNSAVIALRYREPDTARPFRSPVNIGRFPVLALLGIITSGLMFLHFEPALLLLEVAVILIGAFVYKVFERTKKTEGLGHAHVFRKSLFTSREIEILVNDSISYPEKISGVMIRKVETIIPDATVKRAVDIMNAKKIGGIVAIERGRVAGILTEKDVLRKVVGRDKNAGKILVRDVMTRNVRTIDRDSSIRDAISLMARHGIKKLPVTRNGRLEGIITAVDILRSGKGMDHAAIKKLEKFYPIVRHKSE